MAVNPDTTKAIEDAATALAKAAETAASNGAYAKILAEAIEHLGNAYRAFMG